MRYLLLTADFPPIEGGISTVACQLADGLHQREKLAAVGAPQVGDTTHDSVSYPYPVFRIPGYHWGALRALTARPTVFRWVNEHRNNFDRIIALNTGFGGWLGKWLKQREGVGYDVIVYGFEFLKYQNHPFARSLLLQIYRASDRVLAISDFTAASIRDFGVADEKLHRIRLGVNTDRFHAGLDGRKIREKFGAENATILLTVGRLIPRKGHRLVLEALPKILEHAPETVYWIVGRGPEESALRRLCSRLGLEKHVHFHGYVSEMDLPLFFAACDLYVMPTLELGSSVEGYGLVYLEAAACGKPSIAARSGGAAEAVLDQVTGIQIDPERTDKLADAIIHLLSQPGQLQRLGEQARLHAQAHSFQNMLEIF